METVPFPDDYKEALLSGEKTMTIRVSEELGKYQVGQTYRALSYDGEDWGIDVLIKEVRQAGLNQLAEFGVPDSEIARVKNEGGGNEIEVIRFEVMG